MIDVGQTDDMAGQIFRIPDTAKYKMDHFPFIHSVNYEIKEIIVCNVLHEPISKHDFNFTLENNNFKFRWTDQITMAVEVHLHQCVKQKAIR